MSLSKTAVHLIAWQILSFGKSDALFPQCYGKTRSFLSLHPEFACFIDWWFLNRTFPFSILRFISRELSFLPWVHSFDWRKLLWWLQHLEFSVRISFVWQKCFDGRCFLWIMIFLVLKEGTCFSFRGFCTIFLDVRVIWWFKWYFWSWRRFFSAVFCF